MSYQDHTLGQNGYSVITDTATHDGPFMIIQVMAAAVFNAATSEHASYNNTNAISDITSVPAGVTLYGFWDDIKLDSGEIVAYKRSSGAVS